MAVTFSMACAVACRSKAASMPARLTGTQEIIGAYRVEWFLCDARFLLYTEGDMLVGQAFDAKHLEFIGQPFAVAEGIGHSSTGYSAFSASDTGVLAYAGPILRFGQLIWYDRAGKALGSIGPPGDYIDLRLSPNARELAASLRDPKSGNIDIWLTDIARRSTSRFTSGYVLSASPVWSPDGKYEAG